MDRETILALKMPMEAVDVPQLGGSVTVRGLTVGERTEIEVAGNKGQQGKFRSMLLARCIVGDDGKRLFADADEAAIERLPAKPLERLFEAALRLSGYSADEADALEKN